MNLLKILFLKKTTKNHTKSPGMQRLSLVSSKESIFLLKPDLSIFENTDQDPHCSTLTENTSLQ